MRRRARISSRSCANSGWWTSPPRAGNPRRRTASCCSTSRARTKAAEFLKNVPCREAPLRRGRPRRSLRAPRPMSTTPPRTSEAAALDAEIGRLEKAAEELRPWGAFDAGATRTLAARGIVLRYFFTQRNTFDKHAGRVVGALYAFRRSAAPMPRCGSSSWRRPARR